MLSARKQFSLELKVDEWFNFCPMQIVKVNKINIQAKNPV